MLAALGAPLVDLSGTPMRLRVCPAAGSQLPHPATLQGLATVPSFTLVRHLTGKKMCHADLTPGKALHLHLPESVCNSTDI